MSSSSMGPSSPPAKLKSDLKKLLSANQENLNTKSETLNNNQYLQFKQNNFDNYSKLNNSNTSLKENINGSPSNRNNNNNDNDSQPIFV